MRSDDEYRREISGPSIGLRVKRAGAAKLACRSRAPRFLVCTCARARAPLLHLQPTYGILRVCNLARKRRKRVAGNPSRATIRNYVRSGRPDIEYSRNDRYRVIIKSIAIANAISNRRVCASAENRRLVIQAILSAVRSVVSRISINGEHRSFDVHDKRKVR